MAIRILIIEDESLIAQDLVVTIKKVEPDADIVHIVTNVADGIAYLQEKPVIDLIFSDIQLGGEQSFEIFERVTVDIPIIFCTAFNEYALKAFETAGIDYLLKPISKESVAKAIAKYKTLSHKPANNSGGVFDYTSIVEALKKELMPGKLPSIIIHQGERIIPIHGEDIALFYIENGLVKAQLFNKSIAMVSGTLDDLETKFAPYYFRINRQFLVNRQAVKEASQHFNRKLLVHITIPFNEQILVGKEKTTAFLHWLAKV
jgi:two-component system, LytTR family, response regulator LytT